MKNPQKKLTVYKEDGTLHLDYNDADPPIPVPNLSESEIFERIERARSEGYRVFYQMEVE